MTLVIKSDLTITNPKLGKLLVKKILTSGTLIKSTLGAINNTQTDAAYGGVPTKWIGNLSLFEYSLYGVVNSNNTTSGTTFLDTEPFKNAEISFEVSELDGSGTADTHLDLRKLISGSDNYCVRIRITSTGLLRINNRYSTGDTDIQSRVNIKVGDKIKVQLIDNNVQLEINGIVISNVQITTEAQSELNRSGYFGLAKGSLTSVGKTGIKNLIISSIA